MLADVRLDYPVVRVALLGTSEHQMPTMLVETLEEDPILPHRDVLWMGWLYMESWRAHDRLETRCCGLAS